MDAQSHGEPRWMDGRQEIRMRQDSGNVLKETVSSWPVLPIPWGRNSRVYSFEHRKSILQSDFFKHFLCFNKRVGESI